jgi:hypothetical protein
MKTLFYCITGIVMLIILSSTCKPFEEVSEVPEIHFKSYTPFLADTLDMTIQAGELIFSFQDGDADFGLSLTNPFGDTVNFFLVPYQKINGTYEAIDEDIYGRKYAIYNNERLVRTGQNKTIRGEIKLQIFYLLTPPFDTIRYDFYIVDRAGHESNTDSTTDIWF